MLDSFDPREVIPALFELTANVGYHVGRNPTWDKAIQ
jgi:hypothetical protein